MNIKLPFLIIVLVCFSIVGCAQNIDIIPETYVAHKTSEIISIDGKANEIDWQKATWSHNFIDIEGVEKPPYKTNVKMLWDETYFYILAKLEEPHVWANLKQRDTIVFYNNDFEIFIDPDGDTYNYYEMEMNALNTIWDLFVSKPYRETDNVVLNDWNMTGLKSAVSIDGTLNNPNDVDKGWTIELAIPWSVYKKSYFEQNVPSDAFWRVNFSRVNWDYQINEGKYERKKDTNGEFLHEHNWVWSPTGVINMHLPEKWGYVYFSSKEVGSDVNFTIPNDEKIKWELFNLYRAQKAHYSIHKTWLTSIYEINDSEIVVNDAVLKPTIENHNFGWIISIKSPFTNKILTINQEGKFATL